jgi:hypothetical protein
VTGPAPSITHEQLVLGDCQRKRSWPNMTQAMNWAWLLCSKHATRSGVYRCQICRGFHLTRKMSGSNLVVCVAHWRPQ